MSRETRDMPHNVGKVLEGLRTYPVDIRKPITMSTASKLSEGARSRLRHLAQMYRLKAQAILDWLEDKPVDAVHGNGELYRVKLDDPEVPIFDNPYSIYQPGIEASDPKRQCMRCKHIFLPFHARGEKGEGCPVCPSGISYPVPARDPNYVKVVSW